MIIVYNTKVRNSYDEKDKMGLHIVPLSLERMNSNKKSNRKRGKSTTESSNTGLA